jgi:putative transcriptional regulator
MKKYKSELMKVLHEQAVDFSKDGIISAAEMKEYDEDCLVPRAVTTSPATVKAAVMAASGSGSHSRSLK